MRKGELVKKLEIGVEEFILFAIIVLNILDAFEIIGSDLDYIKKIISWTALGMLIYKASPSKIFVGFKRKFLDGILIFAYFLMIIKNLVSYAHVAYEAAPKYLTPLYNFMLVHATTIELGGLYTGLFLIVIVCLYLSLKTPLKAPSILHLMRADKQKYDFKTFVLHFSSLFFIAIAFFLVFFNLVMEWLAIAIDAPLLMIGLASYFFIIMKHKEKFSPGSFLAKFGDFGSKFYEGVIAHLRYKRAFLRVISGMLILHILTDMLTFIWYYLFGIGDQLYLAILEPRASFFELISNDLSISWLTSIIHLSNLITLVFLMITPILLWFAVYTHKKINVSHQMIILIVCSLFISLLNHTFKIFALQNSVVYGVDIQGVSAQTHQIMPFYAVILLSMLITLILSNIHMVSLNTILVIASKTFFILYVVLYFFSIAKYYLASIALLLTNIPFLGIVFIIFFTIMSLFYIIGLWNFLIDTQNHLQETL